jgi:hypothetical protein
LAAANAMEIAAEVAKTVTVNPQSATPGTNEENKDDDRKKKFERQVARYNMQSLTLCRVLHVAAFKTGQHDAEAVRQDAQKSTTGTTLHYRSAAFSLHPDDIEYREEASISLPQLETADDKVEASATAAGPAARTSQQPSVAPPPHIHLRRDRDRLTASDVVQQLYTRNCALCLLSRFGLSDGVADLRRSNGVEIESSVSFIDAFHLGK